MGKLGEQGLVPMEGVRLLDVSVRLGAAYVLCHMGKLFVVDAAMSCGLYEAWYYTYIYIHIRIHAWGGVRAVTHG